jgi:hypothetical protein
MERARRRALRRRLRLRAERLFLEEDRVADGRAPRRDRRAVDAEAGVAVARDGAQDRRIALRRRGVCFEMSARGKVSKTPACTSSTRSTRRTSRSSTSRGWQRFTDDVREAHRADIHQVLAYASLYAADEVSATLVYPLRQGTYEALARSGRERSVALLMHGARRVRLELRGVAFGGRAVPSG